jgi:hypothetical protein
MLVYPWGRDMKTYTFYLAVIVFVTATLGIPTFADYAYTQTSTAQALIGYNLSGSGDSTDTFDITNSTGVTWTDYSIIVGPPSAYSPDVNESYFTSCSGGTLSLVTAPGNPSPNTGIYVNQCEVDGLSIAAGATYDLTVGIGAGEPGWVVYGTPSTSEGGGGGTPAPEPGTMLLLSSGLIGIAGLRRKFNI